VKNNFCQLLNVHRVNNIRQSEIHRAEPLVLEVSIAIVVERLKGFKLPGIDRIPKALIQAGGERHMCGSTNSLRPCYEKD
jgi:hypothetical protein